MAAQLILEDIDGGTYTFPLDFWIKSSPFQTNKNIVNRGYAAGGRNIADGFPVARTITISGQLRADTLSEMETKKRALSSACLKGGKLSINEDVVSRYIAVSDADLQVGEEEGRLFQEVSIVFAALNTYWEDTTATDDQNVMSGDGSFTVNATGSDDIIYPIITIDANQSANLPSIKIVNTSDGSTFFAYNDPTFLNGSTLVINSITGTTKRNNVDTSEYIIPMSSFLRLQPISNSFDYEGNACTITVTLRKRYLIV